MPQLELRLAALVQTLADDLRLAEALLFPEVSCCQDRPARLREMLAERTREAVKQLPPGLVYRHRLGELPQVAAVEVEIVPTRDDVCQQQPISLTFHYVRWRHAGDAVIAYVPALGIEVLAEDEKQLANQIVPQIRSALSRRAGSGTLRDLVMLGRTRRLEVKPLRVRVKLPTLKQAAQRERDNEAEVKSVFREVATDLVRRPGSPIYERESELARLAQLLTGRYPRSVLLVGRSGVGKTALVYELARRRSQFALGGTPLWSTSGSRLVAGMSGFGMWQERCQKLVREASRTKAIVHVDNLIELVEVGKGGGNTQGIAAVLRPSIDRGLLLAVAECTPEQLALVEREDPQLLEAFAQLEVVESSEGQTRAILAQVAEAGPRDGKLTISSKALATLDRLHRRYATYSASPGRPLRFLRNLLEDQGSTSELIESDVTAAFSHETGLPLFMLDDAARLDLEAAHRWFAQRVIGQSEPVELVVNLLAAVKSGLARGGKPIGSLLFIGPTGVGKTEMAKALAEFLYQDPGRMIRFDMSEYAHPAAVERLIGGSCSSQGLLTQKVRDQPFMVVLLDEFEKAHPLVFDLLLQVLGEGHLTDGAGRVADFTNAVVIMTSNLGAETFRRSAVGFAGEAAALAGAQRHFEREVRWFLRPEMFNRLDQIVPFAPLDRATIAGIARREIERVTRRDGLRLRGVKLDIDAAAVEHLAQGGFDPRYGARPLKREIERQLVAPLAAGLSRYSSELAIDCRVQILADKLQVDAVARPRSASGTSRAGDEFTLIALRQLVDLRRKVQTLEQSGVVLRLRNEIYRLKQAERQRQRRQKKHGKPERFSFTPEQARLLAQQELLAEIDRLAREVCALEDNSLGDFYAGREVVGAAVDAARSALAAQLHELLFRLHESQGERKDMLTIALFGESLDRAIDLCRAYEAICHAHQASLRRYWLKMYQSELDVPVQRLARGNGKNQPAGQLPCMHLLHRKRHEEDQPRKVIDVYHPPPEHFHSPPGDCIGLALQIRGEHPAALLDAEVGKHEFAEGTGPPRDCFVETASGMLLRYEPPADVGRRGAMSDLPLRRSYDLASERCRDPLLDEEFRIRARNINEAVAQAVEAYLVKRTWMLLDAWN